MFKKIYQKYKTLIYIIIAALIMYIIEIVACKIYPFGTKSLISGDIAGQYIPFWEYFKDCFIGENSVFYSFGKMLGGNMIGIWAYYLMSPYNIIFLFFSKNLVAEALVIVTGLKFISCSITMYVFLKNKISNKFILLILCLSYAFCGYNISFQVNLMWLDNVILLPLMVFGVEELVNNNKFIMYTITLALSFIVNFYTGFATAIFTGIYFIYYNLLKKFNIKQIIKKCFKFALYSLIGIGIAACIIVPVIFILKSGKGSSFTIDFTQMFTKYYNDIDILAKTLIGAINNNELYYGMPNIYTGLFTIVLLQIYFLNKNIPFKNKILSLVFVLFMFASFNVKILNLIWHGLKEPIGFPYRYSFVFSFLVIAIACNGLKEKNKFNYKLIPILLILDIILILILLKNQYSFISNNMITLSGIAIIFYCITLMIYMKEKNKIYIVLITIVSILELLFNGIHSINLIEHANRNNYVEKIDNYENVVKQVKEYDNSFYRMEKTDNFYLNDSLLFGYNGVGHSSSTFEINQVEFMKKIGYNWYIYFPSYGYGNTLLTDSIFGIKYKLSKEDVKYYSMKKQLGNYKLYENNYNLSLGYATDKYVENVILEGNPFDIQTQLLNNIANTKLEFFNNISLKDIKLENIQKDDNYYQRTEENAFIELTYDVSDVNEELYFWITTPYDLDGTALKIYINDKYIDDYLGANKNGIIKLTCDSDIMKIKLKINTDEKVRLDEVVLTQLNRSNFEIAYNSIKQHQLENIQYKNSTLTADIKNIEQDKYLFTTIPYDEGWNITVDNKQVQPEDSNDFITFKLEPGEHKIKMTYFPKGLKLGLIITTISATLLIVMIFFNRKKYKLKVNNK